MIYAVKKFRHYLLANKFIFFTDHQALLYLVNKPCNTGRIVRWFIILLDFTVVVKKGTTHQRADHLSRLTSGEEPKGIEDDLPDAYLFNIEMIPKWSEKMIPLLTIGQIDFPLPIQEKYSLIQKAASFVMLAGRMYHLGRDGILRLCIEDQEKEHYLVAAHIAVGGIHMAADHTIRRLLWAGVWWPTMRAEVHNFVHTCLECQDRPPIPHATLFQIAVAPQWSKYIVDYLEKRSAKYEAKLLN